MKMLLWIVAALVVLGGVFYYTMSGDDGNEVIGSQDSDALSSSEDGSSSMQEMEREATGTSAETEAEMVEVPIRNYAFVPETLTVKLGTTVVWTNEDSIGHTATANNGEFNSGMLQKGESYSHTFTKVGTYDYYCIPHAGMKAKIIVE